MSEQSKPKQICPYLGLAGDRDSRFSYPEEAHLCFAASQAKFIPIEHQADLCLTGNHPTCPRFVEPSSEPQIAPAAPTLEPAPTVENPQNSSLGGTIIWGSAGLLIGLLVIFGFLYYSNYGFEQQPEEQLNLNSEVVTENAAPVVADSIAGDATPAPGAFLATPTPTATPVPGEDVYMLSPVQGDVGWLTGSEEQGNHFGDSYLYAGILDGQVYQSAFQFDLGEIPRGAPIFEAKLELTGLRDDDLSLHNDRSDADGVWAIRLLEPDRDQDWTRNTFQDIFNAPVSHTLQPILSSKDLATGKINSFELSQGQLKILKDRIIKDENPVISFRIDGPLIGPDNLFAWDTGYGSQSAKKKVVLHLVVGEPPATPPPYEYLVVTSTPTPENVVTAAAIVLQTTSDAARFGTATPTPANLVTATPLPEGLVITPTPTAENTATAQMMAVFGTAEALTTGTPPPLPTNVVTATPTPTGTPTATATPTPTFVVITSTPTAESIFIAATLAVANSGIEPTPLPDNWVTPVVVTSTPTPINLATTQALNQLATAMAVTTGTPTPVANNVVTATPTLVFEIIPLLLNPATATPTPIDLSIPAALLGKILFRSDREQSDESRGPDEDFAVYVYDPATGELGRLTANWPYKVALARDVFSADNRFRALTKDAIRYKNVQRGQEIVAERNDAPAVYWFDSLYNVEEQLTNFGTGLAYGGVWSPAREQIAFISNDSGDDEIWVVNRDGSELRQLTSSNTEFNAREIGKDTFIPELSKFPSWSPDGSKIVFTSNRTGNNQLWIMNADGSDQRLLMDWDNWTPYNDWEPVWVKYLDPPPSLE